MRVIIETRDKGAVIRAEVYAAKSQPWHDSTPAEQREAIIEAADRVLRALDLPELDA